MRLKLFREARIEAKQEAKKSEIEFEVLTFKYFSA